MLRRASSLEAQQKIARHEAQLVAIKRGGERHGFGYRAGWHCLPTAWVPVPRGPDGALPGPPLGVRELPFLATAYFDPVSTLKRSGAARRWRSRDPPAARGPPCAPAAAGGNRG
jgi:hypothetical protein